MKTIPELAPKLITADELKVGHSLQDRHQKLEQQIDGLTNIGLDARIKAALKAYLADPSEKNLGDMKTAAIEHTVFSSENRPRSFAREALKELHKKNTAPWAEVIVARALEVAKKELARVTADENERHLATIGRSLTKSDIVEAARVPVTHCEALLRELRDASNATLRSPKNFVELLGYKF